MQVLKIAPQERQVLVWDGAEVSLFGERGCVFLVKNSVVRQILKVDSLDACDHGWKHENIGLARYLLPQGKKRDRRVQVVRTKYTSRKRLEQGISHLLLAGAKCDFPAPLLTGVPARVFKELVAASGAEPEEKGGEDGFYARLRKVKVPKEVRKRFRGESEEAARARALIVRASESDEAVLIQGETGTGKEIAARLVHEQSARANNSFIAVNCAAISPTLFESELFGYAPGAFTGALRGGRAGLWENADQGSLFLDEVADIPLDCQAKVLRAIQEGKIRRVGGDKEYAVDVRVIAASCRELGGMVASGDFREDLYYRLLGFLIRTPALDAEPERVPGMVQQLWRDITRNAKAELDEEVVELLARRRWPGNFRDIKNFLRRLHLNAPDGVTEGDVRELMEYYGPPVRVSRRRADTDSARTVHRFDCLRHLRRTAEVLRALQTMLESGVAAPADGAAELQWTFRQILGELELLARQPLSFHGESPYAAVLAVREQLTPLHGSLASDADGTVPPRARNAILRAIEDALSALFAETRRLESA